MKTSLCEALDNSLHTNWGLSDISDLQNFIPRKKPFKASVTCYHLDTDKSSKLIIFSYFGKTYSIYNFKKIDLFDFIEDTLTS